MVRLATDMISQSGSETVTITAPGTVGRWTGRDQPSDVVCVSSRNHSCVSGRAAQNPCKVPTLVTWDGPEKAEIGMESPLLSHR